MAKTIYLPKWTELLVALYNTPPEQRYCGRLARTTRMTTRHLRNLVSDLEALKFVRREEGAKIKYINLTDTGEELAEMFLRIYPTLR